MPMPKPKPNEAKETFISRCIETLTKYESDKFPSQTQRAAICYSLWGDPPQGESRLRERQAK